MVQDYQFCPHRLENNAGLLVNRQTGSSGYQQVFSTAPVVPLDTYTWTAQQTFGNLVAINADGAMRQLQGPATPNLFPRTNSAGDLIFDTLPAASIPDPLTLTTINVTNLTASNFTLTGSVFTANSLPTGTVVNQLGLDSGGNVVKASNSTGVQTSMFFESPNGTSITKPNGSAIAGGFLVIGNLLFDSGGNIAQVQDAQTIKILVAGTYVVDWWGQVDSVNTRIGGAILLVRNGVTINNGNTYPVNIGNDSGQNTVNDCSGGDTLDLAVNDTLKLQLGSASGTIRGVYQVRMRLQAIAV